MLFKKYNIHFVFDKEFNVEIDDFIAWLFDDGPQGYYIINKFGKKTKKSTITGTGVNSFVPVVNITISEFNNKISVDCKFTPFMVLKILSAIFLSFQVLMFFFLIFLYNSLDIFVPVIMIVLYVLMTYCCYNFFTSKCFNAIKNSRIFLSYKIIFARSRD